MFTSVIWRSLLRKRCSRRVGRAEAIFLSGLKHAESEPKEECPAKKLASGDRPRGGCCQLHSASLRYARPLAGWLSRNRRDHRGWAAGSRTEAPKTFTIGKSSQYRVCTICDPRWIVTMPCQAIL
jgi:hypothetical protein